jgi:hypothetical protein
MEKSLYSSDKSNNRWTLLIGDSQNGFVHFDDHRLGSYEDNSFVEVKYDADRDEKEQHEAKMKEVHKVEDLRKQREAESKNDTLNVLFYRLVMIDPVLENENDLDKTNDTFVERMQLQVVRNLELSIRNVHIVYEDRSTKPNHPFAFGITLNYVTLHVRT